MSELWAAMEPVAIVIPTLNEAATIGAVIRGIPRDFSADIIVADGGRATARAGAGDRGRGRSRRHAPVRQSHSSWMVTALVRRFDLAGRAAGSHDVLASRTAPAGAAPCSGIRSPAGGTLYGTRYSDMCAFRAIDRAALRRLSLREMTYGWNIEMQMRAARAGLRILEVPLPYRCRAGGASKVAGSFRGTLRAGSQIISTFFRVAGSGHPGHE